LELRVDRNAGGRASFSIISSGKPAPADVWLKYDDGEQHIAAASGELPAFPSLQSATFLLPATPARELKVWAHTITPEAPPGACPRALPCMTAGSATRSTWGSPAARWCCA